MLKNLSRTKLIILMDIFLLAELTFSMYYASLQQDNFNMRFLSVYPAALLLTVIFFRRKLRKADMREQLAR